MSTHVTNVTFNALFAFYKMKYILYSADLTLFTLQNGTPKRKNWVLATSDADFWTHTNSNLSIGSLTS